VQREVLRAPHRLLVIVRKVMPFTQFWLAFQRQLLGPNGRPVATLDVLSVDCAPSNADVAVGSEWDWRHDRALREHVRGTLLVG
jgi:hypothetical protein